MRTRNLQDPLAHVEWVILKEGNRIRDRVNLQPGDEVLEVCCSGDASWREPTLAERAELDRITKSKKGAQISRRRLGEV